MQKAFIYGFVLLICILLIPDIVYELKRKDRQHAIDPKLIKFRTGDIVLFRDCDNFIQMRNSGISINPQFLILSLRHGATFYSCLKQYTHSGIILKINNVVYVYQIHRKRCFCHYQNKYVVNKPALHLLDTVLKKYNGLIYHVPYVGQEPENVDLLINSTKDYIFPNNFWFVYYVCIEKFLTNKSKTDLSNQKPIDILCTSLVLRSIYVLNLYSAYDLETKYFMNNLDYNRGTIHELLNMLKINAWYDMDNKQLVKTDYQQSFSQQ